MEDVIEDEERSDVSDEVADVAHGILELEMGVKTVAQIILETTVHDVYGDGVGAEYHEGEGPFPVAFDVNGIYEEGQGQHYPTCAKYGEGWCPDFLDDGGDAP
ncbi:MAG: hypothetical protein GY847_22275, partial [Proteobacteria bacterium]|nr:hypothetical protein [Pseudomonadota bacterium]